VLCVFAHLHKLNVQLHAKDCLAPCIAACQCTGASDTVQAQVAMHTVASALLLALWDSVPEL
jgi:hypothetical protein